MRYRLESKGVMWFFNETKNSSRPIFLCQEHRMVGPRTFMKKENWLSRTMPFSARAKFFNTKYVNYVGSVDLPISSLQYLDISTTLPSKILKKLAIIPA